MICSINVTKIHFTIKDPLLFLGVFISGGNLQQSQLPSECGYFMRGLELMVTILLYLSSALWILR